MKAKTVARKVYDEIEKEIESIHPWQYQNLNLVSVNYDVILEDIKTYWNQEARFREGFKVDEQNIYVPNFFTKVNGIHKSAKEYVKFVENLKESKNTLYISNAFNFKCVDLNEMNATENMILSETEFKDLGINQYIFYEPTLKNVLEYKYLGYVFNQNHYTFDCLTSSKQKQILRILEKHLQENKNGYNKKELELLISVCFSIPENIISLINNFDYSYDVPKIIVSTNKINKQFAMLLMILNELAIDILLLEPSGKSTIEKHMDIGELSLGYFVDDFNLDEEFVSTTQKMQETASETFSNISETMGDLFPSLLSYIPIILIIILNFISMKNWNGLTNTIIQLGSLLLIYIVGEYIYDEWNDSDLLTAIHIISFIGICILIIVRFFIFLVSAADTTTTYSGYINIEDSAIVCEDGYIIKTNDDAVMEDGYKTLYCYIENNANNTQDIYFKIIVGNSVVYTSSKIKPLEYVKQFMIDCNLPIGENEIKIQYYVYNSEENLKQDCFTDVLLGEKNIMVHVAKDKEELEQFKETYDLNFD